MAWYAFELYWSTANELMSYLDHKKIDYKCCVDSVDSNKNIVLVDENGKRIMDAWGKMRDLGLDYCPFCSGISDLQRGHKRDGNASYRFARVFCTECGCSTHEYITDGYYGSTATEQDAIEAWNRRVTG